jgi:hypothetical protein
MITYLITRIRALTPGTDADRFILEALRAYATKVKDTRKDQPKFNLEWRNLAILTLKEIDNATTTS